MPACHEHWCTPGDVHHVCGREEMHVSWHVCVCGEVLLTNRVGAPGDHPARQVPCPTCLAGVGRPCHTKLLSPMSGVHVERAHQYERASAP